VQTKRRLDQNREAARRSRERKQQYTKHLEAKVVVRASLHGEQTGGLMWHTGL